jgi:hypothetical protein
MPGKGLSEGFVDWCGKAIAKRQSELGHWYSLKKAEIDRHYFPA